MSESLGFNVGGAASRNYGFDSGDFKSGLKDILLGGIGVATTFGLQALQAKLYNPQAPRNVVYAQQAPGGNQVSGVSAPRPVDYSELIKLGILIFGAAYLIKAFKG